MRYIDSASAKVLITLRIALMLSQERIYEDAVDGSRVFVIFSSAGLEGWREIRDHPGPEGENISWIFFSTALLSLSFLVS